MGRGNGREAAEEKLQEHNGRCDASHRDVTILAVADATVTASPPRVLWDPRCPTAPRRYWLAGGGRAVQGRGAPFSVRQLSLLRRPPVLQYG